jgi:hypothetical protein
MDYETRGAAMNEKVADRNGKASDKKKLTNHEHTAYKELHVEISNLQSAAINTLPKGSA